MTLFSRIVYTLVGISGIILLGFYRLLPQEQKD